MILAFVFAAAVPPAETIKLQNPGPGLVPLAGNWRFHLGDDLAWADPKLDESGWEQISPDAPWGAQTHPSYTGFAWYRVRIEVKDAPPVQQLALLFPGVQDAYELYWNGQRIGSYGQLPPHAGGSSPRAAPSTSFRAAAECWP